ncbi:4'-phosphopantetheinyl transferase family protein [Flavobacterium foetidum]|uniref:4'-phosphopantetheinyl transferase family protein n=1 Tax=Flavobacterium foetidum TaxID=2026681 RepID=UPI001074C378|nr:4'-phosphopantetheinyl transferase superfamily protein [Flavobacterium foetidum]KAF2516676.1 4-phosphopantetheinyl transferase family protein [Flavobacterium foetidum]
MIGNDVIDLQHSRLESNWRRKGFVEKLFTDEEQSIIANAQDSEIMIWVLWSMKEAAYKVYNRRTKIREYIPTKLQCRLEEEGVSCIKGIVSCHENTYYTKTTIFKNQIHTIAVSLLENLSKVKEVKRKSIQKDRDNIPFFVCSKKIVHDASVSHHGRFEICVTLI